MFGQDIFGQEAFAEDAAMPTPRRERAAHRLSEDFGCACAAIWTLACAIGMVAGGIPALDLAWHRFPEGGALHARMDPNTPALVQIAFVLAGSALGMGVAQAVAIVLLFRRPWLALWWALASAPAPAFIVAWGYFAGVLTVVAALNFLLALVGLGVGVALLQSLALPRLVFVAPARTIADRFLGEASLIASGWATACGLSWWLALAIGVVFNRDSLDADLSFRLILVGLSYGVLTAGTLLAALGIGRRWESGQLAAVQGR